MSRPRGEPSSWLWAAGLPLALVVLILAADWIEGPKTAFVGVLVVVPMLSAVFATPAVTAVVGAITWLAAFAFGLVAADGNVPAQYIRLGILAVVGIGAVAAAAKRMRIQDQLTQAQLAAADADKVRRQANTDWLTGVLNRRGLAVEFAERAGSSGSVIMLDVDGMKQVNDTLGHRAGDDLLKAVAGRVRSCTQAKDAVGRWGGDEFVVLTDATLEQAQMIADRIRGVVCTQPVRTSVGLIDARLSIGFADFGPGDDIDQALVDADASMYREKRGNGEPVEEG
ncbi:MAG: GGDEF domain-containing protein [Candidatus Nanopelagicales bacterium]|jgi:diguanylate cyclase (GGDEF)-like protein|nr:GGDEF domain-containing protein [Actinomycetota bacterium]HNL50953.1 GGDEF domain-containing protein [Actinomycetota bacterium]HNO15136.1 GGDEF domain-containing protein [Actinomycetota bacterium]HUM86806.1 GGDEF domain-containing protein [Actinomycetota bacterium]